MSTTATAPQGDYRLAKFNKRKLVNTIALTMSFLAMCSGIVWLFWILWDTFMLGIQGLGVHVFTESMPAPNEVGGIGNAIVGSLMLVAVATLIGTPIGIMAGIYLAEYDKSSWLAKTTRFVNDVLLSAPSIVIGIFVAAMLVAPMKTFSGWAGAVALALIVIPVVIRTTENMLNLIPASMREAAYALGTPTWRVVKDITLKSAMAGVVTGVLLAVARIAGETAPLLFTSLSNQFWSTDMSSPMASLPVMIYNFAMSPYGNWQELAWVGVFVITVTVLAINILARLLTRKS